MTPKSLLRHPACVSPLNRFTDGAFETVLTSTTRRAEPASRLLLCSGKIYYDLEDFATKHEIGDSAIVRIEQLNPFPAARLAELCREHADATEVVWVQEEPRNMGAWGFVCERLRELLLPDRQLGYLGRPPAASPATGSHKRHVAEQEDLVRRALDPAGSGVPRHARVDLP